MMKTEIIYEDDHIIVCYKPAGLATQTARVGQPDVVSELKNYLRGKSGAAGDCYIGVVHRLDQPVEGLLVFARTKKAAAGLSAQLSQGTLNKHYYAAVCGQASEKQGRLVDYLAKTSDNKAVVAESAKEQSGLKFQEAVLHYKLIENRISPTEADNCTISLADISIDTGRFHQIRAQMSHAGMTLLGDIKYGNDISAGISKMLNVRNVALCAYELEFKHPITGKMQHFVKNPRGEVFGMFNKFI